MVEVGFNPVPNIAEREAHMEVACLYGKRLSKAKRKQVGCIAVKGRAVISIGVNGTPEGWDNCCETPDGSKTLPHVLHAESNCIAKLAWGRESSWGADIYCTFAPCPACAKLLIQARVRSVSFVFAYRDTTGVDWLLKSGIKVIHLSEMEPEILSLLGAPPHDGTS